MAAQRINVAIAGAGSIVKAHTVGLRALPSLFGGEQVDPRVSVIVDTNPAAAEARAAALAIPRWTTDWQAILSDDAIDGVVIATPNDTHETLAADAMRAGKGVLCEKPLAHSVESAQRMTRTAADTAAVNVVNFNYRKITAIRYLRRLIGDGRLGTITAFRGFFLQDWALDQRIPGSWKFRQERAGAGPVLAVGCHVIDLARHLVGEISDVVGLTEVQHAERPAPVGSNTYEAVATGTASVRIDTDDLAAALFRFRNSPAIGMLTTSRTSPGYKNGCRIEIDGTAGSAIFDYERMNELHVCSADAADGFTRVVMGPEQEDGLFWASSGLGTGFAETMALQMHDFVQAIATGETPPSTPTFEDGLRAEEVALAAVSSASSGVWEPVDATTG